MNQVQTSDQITPPCDIIRRYAPRREAPRREAWRDGPPQQQETSRGSCGESVQVKAWMDTPGIAMWIELSLGPFAKADDLNRPPVTYD